MGKVKTLLPDQTDPAADFGRIEPSENPPFRSDEEARALLERIRGELAELHAQADRMHAAHTRQGHAAFEQRLVHDAMRALGDANQEQSRVRLCDDVLRLLDRLVSTYEEQTPC